MANSSSLVVKLLADSKHLERGLAKSTRKVQDFAKKSIKQLKKITKIGLAGLAAGFTGVIYQINKTSAELDVLVKTSEKLGTSVAALQKLQYQAELSGVSASTLNMALQRMVRRVSEAAVGTGEAVNALKELNINAESLAKLSPDKQFQEIAKAFKNIGNQGDKVRLAMKLFDSEGVALVNTLNSNLAATSKEFDKLGISVTKQQAKAIAAFEDAKTKMGAIWNGLLQQITAESAPAFASIIETINKMIVEWGGLRNIAKQVAGAVVGAVNLMIQAFIGLLNTIDRVIIGFSKIEAFFKKAQLPGTAMAQKYGLQTVGGIDTGQFLQSGAAESRASAARGRIASREAFSKRVSQAAQKARVEITVSTDNQAVIKQIKSSGEVEAMVRGEMQRTTNNAERQVNR